MWVVKLGGSLQSSPRLREWLEVVARGGGRVAVVPGGGAFAEQVRQQQQQWGFDDEAAHRMALLAMEQYACMLCSLDHGLVPAASAEEMGKILRQGDVPVWQPYRMAGSDRRLPRDWTITSDSLALQLARDLNARALVLVKAAAFPGSGYSPASLAQRNLVDDGFPVLYREYAGRLAWFGDGEAGRLQQALATGTLPGDRLISPGVVTVANGQQARIAG